MRWLCQTNVFTLHDESLMIGANDFIFIGLKNLVDSFTNFRGKLRDQNIKVLLLAVTSFRHKQPYYAEKVKRCHNHGKRQLWFHKQFRENEIARLQIIEQARLFFLARPGILESMRSDISYMSDNMVLLIRNSIYHMYIFQESDAPC